MTNSLNFVTNLSGFYPAFNFTLGSDGKIVRRLGGGDETGLTKIEEF